MRNLQFFSSVSFITPRQLILSSKSISVIFFATQRVDNNIDGPVSL